MFCIQLAFPGLALSPAVQPRAPGAMQRLAMDLRMLSRELSLYLEHQVRVGFFGSGVGLSLILGFSVAYACYYLSSIAKVSNARRGGGAGADVPGRARGAALPAGIGCSGPSPEAGDRAETGDPGVLAGCSRALALLFPASSASLLQERGGPPLPSCPGVRPRLL